MASLLALSGFMGSGKSEVGRELSRRLGWGFVDLDEKIEGSLGVSIAEVFRADGEAAFRKKESETLAAVLKKEKATDLVVSLGGGTLETSQNRDLLKRLGKVVFLDVSREVAWRRVVGSDRPLAQDEESFGRLLAERRTNYVSSADWIVPTDCRSVTEVVDRLADLVIMGGPSAEACWARWLCGTARPSLIVGGASSLSLLPGAAEGARGRGARLHAITDENVLESWGEEILPLAGLDRDDVHVVEPGENSKSAHALEDCWEWLAERRARRDDVVLAIGGGVVGDLAGFAAATYHRGIGLWQVPTSLVAQVDSSVGGKTAINLRQGKNLVGAFHQPDLVVIDPVTLATLPDREYVGAFGEVVKHALLSSEEDFVALEHAKQQMVARDPEVLSDVIRRNVLHKASVVEVDEKEGGLRSSLNLGHTTAHALESVLGYGALNHGQAVAFGLLAALAVSERLLGLEKSVRTRTEQLLREVGLTTTLDLPPISAIVASAAGDKKAKAGSSGFVGLKAIGEPVWGLDLPQGVFESALEVIGG